MYICVYIYTYTHEVVQRAGLAKQKRFKEYGRLRTKSKGLPLEFRWAYPKERKPSTGLDDEMLRDALQEQCTSTRRWSKRSQKPMLRLQSSLKRAFQKNSFLRRCISYSRLAFRLNLSCPTRCGIGKPAVHDADDDHDEL